MKAALKTPPRLAIVQARAKRIRPPKHLKPATKQWFTAVCGLFELEEHHIRLLTLACEAWDRCRQAGEALREHGLTCTDRYGTPKSRPEVQIERDNRLAFARILRELDLDADVPPDSSRAPAILSNRRGRH